MLFPMHLPRDVYTQISYGYLTLEDAEVHIHVYNLSGPVWESLWTP